MKGTVLDFDILNNIGNIRGWNDEIYRFTNSDWKDKKQFPKKGLLVDFEVDSNNAAYDIYCTFQNEITENKTSTLENKTSTLIETQEIWKLGKFLVMRRGASLPDRCIKTNRPTTKKVREKLYWHHPSNMWGGDLGIFLTLFLYFFIRREESIRIGLCDEFLDGRRKGVAASRILLTAIFISLIVFIAVIVAASVGIVSFSGYGSIYFFFILFWIPWIFLACRLAVKAWLVDVVSIVWIEDEYIFIKGVNQSYIAEFPEWSDYSDFTLPNKA